jgi:hypothetical protein
MKKEQPEFDFSVTDSSHFVSILVRTLGFRPKHINASNKIAKCRFAQGVLTTTSTGRFAGIICSAI